MLRKSINCLSSSYKRLIRHITWQREAKVSMVSASKRQMRLFHLCFLTEGRARSSETVGLSDGSGANIIRSTV